MRHSHKFALIGFFLAVICAVPLTQAGIDIAGGAWPQALDILRTEPTAGNLRAFEREAERSSAIAGAIRPWVEYGMFTLLRSPGEQAILGRDGWLFYKPDVRYLIEPCSQPIRAIERFRDELAGRGIRLLVVPIPGKPSVYPDRLTGRVPPGARLPSHTRELVAALRAARVEVVDLLDLPALRASGEPAYLRRDTHWTAATARRSAEVVAVRIRAMGVNLGTAEYISRPVTVSRRGDVVRMMRAARLDDDLPAEPVSCEQVMLRGAGGLYRDDPVSPVLVLGDSFLRIYETDEPKAAGFIAHLARELRQPVASIVNDGGASTLVREQLARKPELLEGKKVVVWEFVERDIRFGAEGWRDVPLSSVSLR